MFFQAAKVYIFSNTSYRGEILFFRIMDLAVNKAVDCLCFFEFVYSGLKSFAFCTSFFMLRRSEGFSLSLQ